MSTQVHEMFSSIAPRYDRANDVLSFGLHRLWRDRALKAGGVTAGNTVIDLCTGTGDVAFAAGRLVGPTGKVFGLDFVLPMLELAATKRSRMQLPCDVQFLQGDAMSIPFPDASADNVTVSFGIRNVDDPQHCLKEMFRVLRPGGAAIVIEFGKPRLPVFREVYNLYCRYVMPIIGGMLTGNRAAYEYLPRTSKAFPAGEEFAQLMRNSGFPDPQIKPLLTGLAYIYIGRKPA